MIGNERKNFNILVTSISKKIPLLKAVKKAALRLNPRIKIIGGDSSSNCIGSYFVDTFWHMPVLDQLSVESLKMYCKENNIRAIIPSRNGELNFFSQHKIELAKDGISVMVSDQNVVDYCLDKLKFYLLSMNNGLPIIPTYEDIKEIKGNACVVKERFGAGAVSLGLNLSEEGALAHAKELDNPIFQPYIEGNEYSVDIYVDKLKNIKGIIMRRRDLVINGESQITTTYYNEKLNGLCHKFIGENNFYGHIILQVLIDSNDDIHIIECNPRFGGASSLSIAAGLDSFYWFLLEATGEDITDYPFICDRNKRIRQITYPENEIRII